jgi:hypothetical protein
MRPPLLLPVFEEAAGPGQFRFAGWRFDCPGTVSIRASFRPARSRESVRSQDNTANFCRAQRRRSDSTIPGVVLD